MSSKKQVKYANKMLGQGFVTVRSWIPKEKTEELKQITKAWREEKKEVEE